MIKKNIFLHGLLLLLVGTQTLFGIDNLKLIQSSTIKAIAWMAH